MDQEVQNVVVEETKTENADTQTAEQNEVKTFTQEEVNAIVQERLKKMPSKEEIAEYRSWKESQKTPNEIQEELNNKITSLESNNNNLVQELAILKSGVKEEDVEYIQFKVSKMDGDFKENLKTYLSENPKFTQIDTPVITTGISQNSTNVVDENEAYLDKKYANNPFYKK